MKRLRSSLPCILLLLFPLTHILLIGACLPEKEKTGFWQIGATAFFFCDILLVGALICLLYARMSWKARVNALTILGILPVFFGILSGALDDQKTGLPMILAINGGAALVVLLCGLWLRTQKHLREL